MLQDYVRRQAEHDAGATCLRMGAERLTYGDLERSGNRLARLLAEAGCRGGDRVCLVMEKSPAAIVAMHGALKAGCAYVPVDVESPAPRAARIVAAAEPRVTVVDPRAAALLDAIVAEAGPVAGERVGTLAGPEAAGERFELAFTGADLAAFPAEPPPAERRGGEVAHLLFTSGSTGAPKGVMITHDNVHAFVEWAVGHFGTRPGDRVSGHPPLHFDLSTFDIYGTFAAGATLHLVPARAGLLPAGLAAFIRDERLTQWFSVPSAMTYLAKAGVIGHGDFPELERVLWCGEVLPTPVLRHWMERLPHASFTNLYGPTEATIASSFHVVERLPGERDPIPIGRACGGEELHVLDERLAPAPPGEIGEIFISGAGLSPGYWRDPEKTAAAFLDWTDPSGRRLRIYRTGDLGRLGEDGLVHFLGRRDSQVKSRGYRIELGEIEAALASLPLVGESAVVAVESDGFEGVAICCAFAPAAGGTTARDVRRELARLVPSYMLPSRWEALPALPKNVNGKIDRRALRERFAAQAAAAAAERAGAAR